MTGWVILFLLLVLLETFVGDFTALTISIGALTAAFIAYFHLPILFQVIIFTITSVLSFAFLRPYVQRRMIPVTTHFTADSFIGNKALVIDKISKDKKGRIKIGGEIWFAESPSDIEEGDTVIISEIDGTTMKVVPEKHITE